MEDMCCFTAVKKGRIVCKPSASRRRLYLWYTHNSACKFDLGRLCSGPLVLTSKRSFALSNKETFEHLGRQFVGGIVRVEEAIPKLVARLVATLTDSGTAAASILRSAAYALVAISASSSSLLLSAALALVPCFLEFLRLRRP
jgi:hypothetical protein